MFLGISQILFLTGCLEKEEVQTPQQVTIQAKPQCEQNAVPNQYIITWKDGSASVATDFSESELKKQIMAPFASAIKYVEKDYLITLGEIRPSADATVDPVNWGVDAIRAPAAWKQNIIGSNTIVAVVDSGVDVSHVQLKGQLFVNQKEFNGKAGVDDDGNGIIDDISGYNFAENSPNNRDEGGHGTHVSGIILADHQAGPILGVAPKARLLPLDFMKVRNGSLGGTTSDAIRAIDYAVVMGAKVINASWGGSDCSKAFQDKIDALAEKGVIFAVAAGNSGSNLSRFPEFPAAFPSASLISVGASTYRFVLAGFSNFGELVHVVAPGKSITSTYPGNRYQALDGTSMATPFVSGVAALLWSAHPNAKVTEIRQAILDSVERGPFEVKTQGEVRVDAALELLAKKLSFQ